MRKRKPSNFRRHREGKTDYRKRLKLLRSRKPRLVVRKTLKQVIVQVVKYSPRGDKTIIGASSNNLKNFGWLYLNSSTPSAYLTGFLCGIRALQKGVKEAILDIGLNEPIGGTKIYAALKGALDAGLKIPSSTEVFPAQDRVHGKHIEEYARNLKESNPSEFKKRFSNYLKNNIDPTRIQDNFKKVLENLKKGGTRNE